MLLRGGRWGLAAIQDLPTEICDPVPRGESAQDIMRRTLPLLDEPALEQPLREHHPGNCACLHRLEFVLALAGVPQRDPVEVGEAAVCQELAAHNIN
jgi:hypothetical protein